MLYVDFRSCKGRLQLRVGCVPLGWSISGSVIRDHSDHSRSKRTYNSMVWIHLTSVHLMYLDSNNLGSPILIWIIPSYSPLASCIGDFRSCKGRLQLRVGCVPLGWSISGSVIRDHSDHSRSKRTYNSMVWIHLTSVHLMYLDSNNLGSPILIWIIPSYSPLASRIGELYYKHIQGKEGSSLVWWPLKSDYRRLWLQ